MKYIVLPILAAWLASALPAAAQNPAYTPADVAQLPPHCLAKLKFDPRYTEAAFAPRFGEYWIHLHHYCHGLKWVNRARASADRRARLGNLGMAKGEYQYAARAAGAGFWMRPQIYVELGQVHLGLGQLGEALRLFTDVIGFSPTYVAAYLGLIEAHRKAGSAQAALEAATAGLRQAPDSQLLQKAYLELGGRQPFPEPLRRAEPQAQRPLAGESVAIEPAETPAAPDRATGDGSETTNPSPSGCRFCPPEEIQQRWRESFGEPASQQ